MRPAGCRSLSSDRRTAVGLPQEFLTSSEKAFRAHPVWATSPGEHQQQAIEVGSAVKLRQSPYGDALHSFHLLPAQKTPICRVIALEEQQRMRARCRGWRSTS